MIARYGQSAGTALVSTRISEREQRPRSLPAAISHGYRRASGPPGSRYGAHGAHALHSGGRTTHSVRPVIPRHVRACVHSSYKTEQWYLWTWDRSRPLVQTRVPYRCNSWRCEGACARHEAAVTFARIRQATHRGELEPTGWVYAVLTIDREGYYSGRRWPSIEHAYAELSRMSRNLLSRLRRRYDDVGGWVAVVEAHRSGWPHLNLMLYCPTLATELREQEEARKQAGATDREAILLSGRLLEDAESVGWGRQSTAESGRDIDAINGYIVKLAGHHDRAIGEISKLCQAPTNAPPRFRRLRSAKGFLPPRHHSERTTGVMLRRRRSVAGDWEIPAVNPPRDPTQAEAVERAIAAETELIREEEELLTHGDLPPMPPLRRCVAGRLESWDAPSLFRGA